MLHFLVNLVNDRARSRVNPSKVVFGKNSNIFRAVFYEIRTFWENGRTSENTRVFQSYFCQQNLRCFVLRYSSKTS